MSRGPLVTVVALVVLAVAGSLTGTTAASRPSAGTTRAGVSTATLVCPDLRRAPVTTATVADLSAELTPPSTGTGTVTTTPLVGARSRPSPVRVAPLAAFHSTASVPTAVAVTARGAVASGLAADQVSLTPTGRFRGLTGAQCVPPASDWWFGGADGRVGFTDTLVLANPAVADALATVSVWSDTGPVTSPRLQSIRVPARSQVRIPVASVAPDAAYLVLHVHAESGAVSAALDDVRTSALRAGGSDWVPATAAPARTQTVAGFPSGGGVRELYVGNPGNADASVSIRLVTTSGTFTPTGTSQLVVRAGRTVALDVTGSLAKATGAVVVSSDQPVVAQGLSQSVGSTGVPDISWQAATAPLGGPGGVANASEPDGGQCQLLVTAPKAGATLRVGVAGGRSQTVTVAAGHSSAVDVTALVGRTTPHALTVTPLKGGPVFVTRTLSFAGAHGALQTSEPVAALPQAATVPPVVPDPRLAVK